MCAAATSWSTSADPLAGTAQGWASVRPTRWEASRVPARASASSEVSLCRSMVRFSTAPSESTTTKQRVQRREADELDRADGGGVVRGADDDGGVGGQLGEQARGALEHRLHFAVDLLEELRDLLALDRAEDAGPGQVVDEEAIALVGRDAAGAGVGLDQVALALERHHFRADRGGGHLDPGRTGDVGGADGLGGPDVLGDHRLQNGGPAGVEGALVVGNVGDAGGVSGRSHRVPGTQVYRVPGPYPWPAAALPGAGAAVEAAGLSRHPGATPRRRPPGAPPPGRCSSSSSCPLSASRAACACG